MLMLLLIQKCQCLGFFPGCYIMLFLNAHKLKALRVEPNNDVMYGRIRLQFQLFCNTYHDQNALIPLHQIFLFVWLICVRTIVNVPFSNVVLFFSEFFIELSWCNNIYFCILSCQCGITWMIKTDQLQIRKVHISDATVQDPRQMNLQKKMDVDRLNSYRQRQLRNKAFLAQKQYCTAMS